MKKFSQRLVESLQEPKKNKYSNKVNKQFVSFVFDKIKKLVPSADLEGYSLAAFDYNKSNQVEAAYSSFKINEKEFLEDQDLRDKLVKFGYKRAKTTENPLVLMKYTVAMALGYKDAEYTSNAIELKNFKDVTDFFILELDNLLTGQAGCLLTFETEQKYMSRDNYD